MDGLDCLGVEDQKGLDYVTFLKKYGPNVIDKKRKAKVGGSTADWFKKAGAAVIPQAATAAEDALKDKPKDGGVDADKAKIAAAKKGGSGGGNWFTDPVMGPVPGWGVLGIVAGAVGAVGLVVKKVFF